MYGRRQLLLLPIRSISTSAVREADLLTNAYLKQIRDVTAKQKAGDVPTEYKKNLQEQLNRLAKKFQLSSAESVAKLDLKFEKPDVQSSVAAFSDGKPVQQFVEELQQEKRRYDQEQAEKKRAIQELRAKMGLSAGDDEFVPFVMPLKEEEPKKPAAIGSR